MLEKKDDAANGDANSPLRQFRLYDNGPVSRRSTFSSNNSSGGTVVVAVNDSLLRPGSDKRLFRHVMRFSSTFFAPFGLCSSMAGLGSANINLGRASVIEGDIIEIRGERIRLVSVDAPEFRQTCLDDKGCAWRFGQQAGLALSDIIGDRPVAAFRRAKTSMAASRDIAALTG